jgi:LPXTG-site transpeptidase (sortase) family protein
MAQELAPRIPLKKRRRKPWSKLRLLMLIAGIGCIVAGAGLMAGPLYSVFQRGANDQKQLTQWLPGAPKSGLTTDKTLTCGSGAAGDYALVRFNDPARYGYAAVAGDGDWTLLDSRSMVHYHGSADPGQLGNMIIAFHREPDFEHIDQLGRGGIISVQDRACKTYRYQVTAVWTGDPADVNQLVTTTGHDLTLITCTPWWVDNQRIVWRATLIP